MDGKLVSQRSLIISRNGKVQGDIKADKIIVNGELEGNCYANTMEILAEGKVSGSIFCDDLSIEKGGRLLGRTFSTVDDNGNQPIIELEVIEGEAQSA